MGKPTKLRNRLPNKPASLSSDSLEERLNKIETSQARNTSNVFKYAFFFFMGMGLTIILYPEISAVLAGIRETSITSTETGAAPSKEVVVEQEYNLDDDNEEVEDPGDISESQTLENFKKPNKTTFKYSEEPDNSVKSIPLKFEHIDTGVEHAQDQIGNEDEVMNTIKDDNAKAAPVTFERFENIEEVDNIDIDDDILNRDARITQDTNRNEAVKTDPTKVRKSDPLEGETEAEENIELKSINPRKDDQVSKSANKIKESNAKKTVVKEVKVKRVEPMAGDQKSVNKKNRRSSHEKSSNDMETRKEQKLPKEILEFNATILKGVTPKKIFADGRRIPPTELLPQKPNNSSVKVWMFEEFLSEAECDGLIRVHNQHVQEQSKQDPILCFDSVSTLRKHLRNVGKKTLVTPRDFTPGTTCVNATFSRQLKDWLKGNWSYSTAFYPGESRFSTVFEQRVKEAMGLLPENGGKFQITSYPSGIGYKTHTDCIEDNEDQRDRVATVLVYLDTVSEGGETMFPELGIWVRPRKARALVWNNMDENGRCEPMSIHKANKVEKGRKIILQRWYYYKSFYSLGKRPPEPHLPQRNSDQPRVSCDEYEHGSCRWYDEWNFDHMVEYERQKYSLV